MPEIEISDKEYRRKQMEKRHKELLAAVKGIKLPEHKGVDLSPIISKIEGITNQLSAKLEEISKPKLVVQKTEVNQAEIVSSLKELIKEVKELKKAPKQDKNWVFDVVRNNQGFIQSVLVRSE